MQDDFGPRNASMIKQMMQDKALHGLTRQWFAQASKHEYSYHFTWLGRPIIQFPQDIVAVQELIWRVRPDLIVETGVARGGSLIFHASMLELLGGNGRVVGIDIDIRDHNRVEIESHDMMKRITMIDGSSIEEAVVEEVRRIAERSECVMVVLDSMHTHDHVLAELNLYSPLVTVGSYLIVMDTIIEHMPADFFPDRPWSPGNSPATAVQEFLNGNDRFEVDDELDGKLLITVAPGGYLKCVRE